MDVIKLLDNYKISITDNPNYLKVLSVIYLHYKINEEDLLDKVKFTKNEKLVLPILFKNGLIERTKEKDLRLTPNCVSFLEAFNIDDIVIVQLINKINLNKFDKLLLKTSLESTELDSKSKKDIINLLRSIALAEEAIKEQSKIKFKKAIIDCTFHIIFHYITKDINLSPKFLYNRFTDSCMELNSPRKEKSKFLIYKKNNKRRIVDYISKCHNVFEKSNSYHFNNQFNLDFETNFLRHEAVFLTTIRHTSMYIHLSFDDDLDKIINTGYDIHSPFSLIKRRNLSFNKILDSIYHKGLIENVASHIPIFSLIFSFIQLINSNYQLNNKNIELNETYKKMIAEHNLPQKEQKDSALE